MTPLDKVELLYQHLVEFYGEANDREIRAASKLLMVAFAKLKAHAGPQWQGLVEEYLQILVNDPQRYEKMMNTNRSSFKEDVLVIGVVGKTH
jgi:hypothetical protein